jgi:hypothetical protein
VVVHVDFTSGRDAGHVLHEAAFEVDGDGMVAQRSCAECLSLSDGFACDGNYRDLGLSAAYEVGLRQPMALGP